MNQNAENPLFEMGNLTDFELLMFERHHVKCLKQISREKDKLLSNKDVEIVRLKSDLEELKDADKNVKRVINQRIKMQELEKNVRHYKTLWAKELAANQEVKSNGGNPAKINITDKS